MGHCDTRNKTYCDDRLSLGEFPWHGKRQSSSSGSEKSNRQWWTSPPTHISVSLSIGGSPLTWQWGLGLAKYWRQCRRRGETGGKRLSGGQAIGSAGTWMNLRDNRHVPGIFTAILLFPSLQNTIIYYHVYLCVWDRADGWKRHRGHMGLEEPWG